MIYCEYCNKEVKYDEWRELIISERHLVLERKKYSEVCKMKYIPYIAASFDCNMKQDDVAGGHASPPTHQQNLQRLEFQST